MPKIQQYEGLQVAPAVTRDADINPSTITQANFGRGIGQGLGNLADAAAGVQTRIAKTEAQEALTAFEKEKNDIFFNPDTGYFNLQGKNAYDESVGTAKKLAELKAKYGDNLSSETAKRMFSGVADTHIMRANEDINRHAAKNLKAWQSATQKAQIENTLENSVLYWNDPKRLSVQRELGRQTILEISQDEGIGPEATNEKLQTYDSTFYSGAIQTALGKNYKQAQQLFKQHKDSLEGPDRLKLEQMFEQKRKANAAKYYANQSVNIATGLVAKYGDLDNARSLILDEINNIKDPKLRKQAMRETMYQLNLNQQAREEEQSATYEGAQDFLLQGGSVDQFINDNPDQWENLTAKQKAALTKGPTIETDFTVYSDLMLLPPEKLAQIKPRDYVEDLATPEYKQLVIAVKSAKNKGTDHQLGRTRNAQVTTAIELLMDEKKSSWSIKDKEKANRYYSLIDREVKFREEKKGAPLTSEEFTELLDGLKVNIVTHQGVIYDNDVDLSEVDDDDIERATKALHSRGIDASGENIIGYLNNPEFLTNTEDQIKEMTEYITIEDLNAIDGLAGEDADVTEFQKVIWEIYDYLEQNNIPRTQENVVKFYNKMIDANK